MIEMKKIPFNTVQENVINMSFDKNPNIPTSNYNKATLETINEVIKRKMRAEKIKKIIESELKPNENFEDDNLGLSFTFGSM